MQKKIGFGVQFWNRKAYPKQGPRYMCLISKEPVLVSKYEPRSGPRFGPANVPSLQPALWVYVSGLAFLAGFSPPVLGPKIDACVATSTQQLHDIIAQDPQEQGSDRHIKNSCMVVSRASHLNTRS
jgi:hypothetical protein